MKILIIGASTPGLFAAYLLAKAGVQVEVYERSKVLGAPLRTLIVTSKISDVLGFVPDAAIVNQVTYVELFSKSRSARLKLSQPDLIIERGQLIELLARKAEGAGARIIRNVSFLNFAQLGGKVIAVFNDLETGRQHHVSADVLVGADGAFSAVSRAANRNGHLRTALLQARVPQPRRVRRDTFQVWFDTARTKYFYWLIPESEGVAAVGLIAGDARQAGASLKSFLHENDLQPLDFQSAMVPMHKFEDAPGVSRVGRNVFLIGDAAAQVKVTTVGGVVTGLRGAKAVAEVVLNGSDEEMRALKRELDLHLFLRRLLDGFTDADYDALLGLLEGNLKAVLAGRSRDELAPTFLRLIAAEPRLLTLGAKAFIRTIL